MKNSMKRSPQYNKKDSATRRNKLSRKILPALIAGCFAYGPVYANPTGAQVVSGQVSISNNGNTLTVANSPGSIINWQNFSVNPGELTQFLQQSSSSAVLNRIIGQNPSQIFGTLQSNGKVYLINPNGVVFGAHSQVNVAGLVASSLDITNADFAAGKLNFNPGTNTNTTPGAVTNQGNITTPSGGQVYLIAPQVQNNGIINSPQGEVLLAAGHSVQLVDSGNPDIQVVVSAPADQAVNLGSVVAQGGKIGIYGALVNQTGIVNADSAVLGQNGQIVFKASATTTLSGNSQTTAIGSGNGTTGGTVEVLGTQVNLTDNAQIDVSGQNGGGSVVVGGYPHGENTSVLSANNTSLGTNTVINANAVTSGNGGNVMVSSSGTTSIAGIINAQGGSASGNGGTIDTSGAQLNVANGALISTSATMGFTGTWLLDPQDFTVGSTLTSGCGCGGTSTIADITGVTLGTNLGTNNVTILSSQGANSGSGNININTPVSWSGNTTLTLTASNNVYVNSNITSTGATAGLAINAGTANGNETATAGGTLRVGSGTAISMQGSNATLTISEPGGAMSLADSAGIAMLGNHASITISGESGIAYTLGSGALITLSGTNPSLSIGGQAYTVINNLGAQGSVTGTDLQGINGNLNGYYVLGTNIDASATASWNSGAGFSPIGSSSAPFSGVFDGLGHTIRDLSISQPSSNNIGLFGYTTNSFSISNLNVIGTINGANNVGGIVGFQNGGAINSSSFNGTVSGADSIGGLVGDNNNGLIANNNVTGTVTGSIDIGGLVGYNSPGSIYTSSFNGMVSGANNAGGLVGLNNGTIQINSSAAGTVFSVDNAGGLAGSNAGTIVGSSASSVVSGNGSNIGGLVGHNTGLIDSSSASGNVTGTVSGQCGTISTGCNVGGLVGYNLGTISNSNYSNFSGTVSGNGNVGGLVGLNDTTGAISGSNVNVNEFGVSGNANNIGGVAGYNTGTITSSSFTGGTVSGTAHVGGLAGYNDTAGVISGSYARTDVTASANYTGGLTGYNAGTISNSYFMAGTVSGASYVGGLVGYNSSTGGIYESYASGNVVASGNGAGGLVGSNYGLIANSYAITTVAGSTGVGGLVGTNGLSGETLEPSISNSYAIGSASGSNNVGGLVGSNYGTISTTYASVFIPAPSSTIGGLVGNNGSSGTISQSYWNSSLDSSMTGVGSGNSSGVGALTATEMRSTSGFAGFNFIGAPSSAGVSGTINAWVMVDSDGTMNNTGSASGAVLPMLTTEYSTTITNGHQLQLMTLAPGATYTMGSSGPINLSNTGAGNDVWGSAGFIPVGTTSNPFTGTFNGQSATINNLNIQSSANNVGLFGVLGQAGTINNINLTNLSVSGGNNVGGLAGYNDGTINSSMITNNGGTVSGARSVGGLVGYNNNTGTINSSTVSSVTVSGSGSNIGGMVGSNYGTINNGNASAVAVSGNGNQIGGLVGANYGSIYFSTASGNVSGINVDSNNLVGGLVGLNAGAITSSSFSDGSVSGGNYVGGLVGKNTGSIAGNANGYNYASGTVTGNNYVGGLVGGNIGTTLNPVSINYGRVESGSVSGAHGIGGLVGSNQYGSIATSHATIDIMADGTNVGGLVGINGSSGSAAATISNSYATGSVNGGSAVGGLVGLNYGTVNTSFAAGNIGTSGNGTQIGGLVGYNYGSISNSYATGAVGGASDVGGLVGNNTSSGVITNTYSVGVATGSNPGIGGLVGTNNGTASNSFFNNTNASGIGAGTQQATVFGVSTSTDGLMNLSNFTNAGWNITGTGGNTSTTWFIYNGYTMPLLNSFLTPLTVQSSNQTVTYTGTAAVTSLSMPQYGSYGSSIPENVFTPESGNVYNGASNAGTYSPVLYSNQLGFNISYGTGTCAGTLTILPAPLTVTGSTAGNKVYDGTTLASVNGGTLSGVIGYDSVSLVQSGQFTSKNVGSNIAVTTSDSLTGSAANNYVLTQPTGLAASISPATLTVTGETTTNKVYDGSTTDILSGGVLAGVMPGDSINLVQTGTFAGKNVGTGISVTPNDSISGAAAGNYTLVQPAGSFAANITPAILTFAGAADNKVYDGTTTATLSGTLTGVVAGDAVTVTQAGNFAGKNVGTGIAVTVTGSLSGAGSSNYILVEPTGLTANITPLALSVSASGTNKVYDGTVNDVVTLVSSGMLVGDTVSVSDTSASFNNKNVGNGKTVLVSGLTLSGADAGNYTIANNSLTTTANITPATLTISGEIANNKVYDGTTTATLTGGTLNGVIAGDTASLNQTGTFASSNIGNNITVTANNSLSGADAQNYTLVQPTGLTANITSTPTVAPVTIATINQNAQIISATNLAVIGATPTLDGVPTGGSQSSTLEIFPTSSTGGTTSPSTTNTTTGASNNGTAQKLYCD